VVQMSTQSRQERTAALEAWAERVDESDLTEADTSVLRTIAALVDEGEDLERAIREAVSRARSRNYSWSQIGAMLGVSKQAAQRKYANA